MVFLSNLEPHLNKEGYLVVGANEEVPEVEWLKKVNDTHQVYIKDSHDY